MSSSLSSVVSKLVRASMGTSISGRVTDDDLDRHVAELIVKEAKKKAERYGQQGIRAYISSNLAESNAPRTNKRFLTSIIKSTDDHNKTVLKAQAAAAQEVQREREEQERRERRARAAEAAEAEKLRQRSKRKRDPEDESWDRWDGRTTDRKRTSRTRNWDNWGGYDDGDDDDGDDDRSRYRRRRTSDRSRSRSRERRGDASSRSSRTKHDSSSSKRHKTHRNRSSSPRRNASRDKSFDRQDDDSRTSHRCRSRVDRPKRSRSSGRSPSLSPHKKRKPQRYALDDLRDESLSPRSCSTALGSERQLRERRSSTPSTSKSYPTPRRDKDTSNEDIDPISCASRHNSPCSRIPSRLSSPSPGPQPPIQLPSKMDRYFEASYDPRLDVAPLPAPKVPATGLINNAEFEGWDAMLELIRVRREDKEEKKRLERLGLSKEKVKVKKNVPISSSAAVADRWSSEGVSILDIEYKKRGSVREWDLGKEGI